jgi:hypothetical protein
MVWEVCRAPLMSYNYCVSFSVAGSNSKYVSSNTQMALLIKCVKMHKPLPVSIPVIF